MAPEASDALVDDEEGLASSEEIDIVVAQIKRLVRTASLEFALRVGAVIIHHFYAGDTAAWRARGAKVASFKRLAEHPDLPLSAGSLYRCVALFELCERLNAPSRWEHLGVSHLRQVLGLPAPVQERILAMANSKRWTVKVLQREVLKEKGSRVTYGGRNADPPLTKSLRKVQRCLEEHCQLIESEDIVSNVDVQKSEALIEAARRCLDRLSSSLSARLVEGGCAVQDYDAGAH